MTQYVDFPTHNSGSILDLVISTDPTLVTKVEEYGYIGKSDHKALTIDIDIDPVRNNKDIFIDDWKNADIQGIKNHFLNLNWQELFFSLNTEQSWTLFKSELKMQCKCSFQKRNSKVQIKLRG